MSHAQIPRLPVATCVWKLPNPDAKVSQPSPTDWLPSTARPFGPDPGVPRPLPCQEPLLSLYGTVCWRPLELITFLASPPIWMALTAEPDPLKVGSGPCPGNPPECTSKDEGAGPAVVPPCAQHHPSPRCINFRWISLRDLQATTQAHDRGPLIPGDCLPLARGTFAPHQWGGEWGRERQAPIIKCWVLV